MEKIGVAIADDNERIIHMLGSVIASDSELELVGQADNGKGRVKKRKFFHASFFL